MNNYFRYENEVCPICQRPFVDFDDIVVCPVCGTPHHRECYKKNGECGNFEKHNEGFRWAPTKKEEPVPPQSTASPFAQQPFGQQDEFPPYTQQPFMPNTPPQASLFPPEFEDGVLTAEVADFVQMNSQRYLQKFFYTKSNKKTFNWAAFFFAPYWFFYRKLYKFGAIFLALFLLLNVGFNLLPPVQRLYEDMTEWTLKYENETFEDYSQEELMEYYEESMKVYTTNPAGTVLMFVQSGLALALKIFIGVKANKWYYDHTIKNIKKIQNEEPNPQNRRLLYFRAGGASTGAAVLAVLANSGIVMAVDMLLTFIK